MQQRRGRASASDEASRLDRNHRVRSASTGCRRDRASGDLLIRLVTGRAKQAETATPTHRCRLWAAGAKLAAPRVAVALQRRRARTEPNTEGHRHASCFQSSSTGPLVQVTRVCSAEREPASHGRRITDRPEAEASRCQRQLSSRRHLDRGAGPRRGGHPRGECGRACVLGLARAGLRLHG